MAPLEDKTYRTDSTASKLRAGEYTDTEINYPTEKGELMGNGGKPYKSLRGYADRSTLPHVSAPPMKVKAMSPDDSVTHWITQLRHGDADAAQPIWHHYFPTLVSLARARLHNGPHGMADEEDVAASVMESLFRAAREGRFPNLTDRDNLWRLIGSMTARKVVDLKRRELRQRRGGGRVHNETAIGAMNANSEPIALNELMGAEPTPDFALAMAEECQQLLAQLRDPELEALALAKLQGYTNAEISHQQQCSERTIERRLRLIRKKWEEEPPE